ncbi:MAG: hypothetical protein ACR2F8_02855 [Caulobacteraceae bacterium]
MSPFEVLVTTNLSAISASLAKIEVHLAVATADQAAAAERKKRALAKPPLSKEEIRERARRVASKLAR